MTGSLVRFIAPTFIRRSLPRLRTGLEDTYKIVPIEYDPDTFMDSPGADEIGWNKTDHPEVTAGAFNGPGPILQAIAAVLGKHADTMKGRKGALPWGEVHILNHRKNSHAYVHVSPWIDLPTTLTDGPLVSGTPNEFRKMPYCFPSFIREQDTPLVTTEKPGMLEWIIGDDPTKPSTLAAFRKKQWSTSTFAPIGPYIQLGQSSTVRCELYTEMHDTVAGMIVRAATMGTTSYHVFDGRYTWITITDLVKRRMMLAGIGGGRHKIPEMDDINPIGGAAVLSTTFQTYLFALQNGLDLSIMTREQLDAVITKANPELAWRRSIMYQGDSWGVGMALARGLDGPNLSAELESMLLTFKQ